MTRTESAPLRSSPGFAAALVAGLLLRFGWVLWVPHRPIWDEIAFDRLGSQIAQGAPTGLPFWPPGWPWVVGFVYTLAGPAPRAVLLLNALLSTLLLAVFGLWAERQFGRRTALIAVWFMALSPSYLLAAGLLLYETLLQLLLVTALLVGLPAGAAGGWSWARAGVLGALCGAILLIRPTWGFLALLVWGVAWINGSRVRLSRGLAAQIVALLLAVPWIVAASAAAGRFVPVALQGGLHLWMANHAGATGTHVEPPAGYYDPAFEPVARAAALDYLRAHPLHPLALLPAKLYYSFRGEAWSQWVISAAEPPFAPAVQRGLVAATNAGYWLMLALAVAGIAYSVVRRERALLAPLAVFAVLTAAQVILFTGQLKHRWPLNFILIAYAALALGWLWDSFGARRASP